MFVNVETPASVESKQIQMKKSSGDPLSRGLCYSEVNSEEFQINKRHGCTQPGVGTRRVAVLAFCHQLAIDTFIFSLNTTLCSMFFFFLISRYSLSVCYVPDTSLGAGDNVTRRECARRTGGLVGKPGIKQIITKMIQATVMISAAKRENAELSSKIGIIFLPLQDSDM